MKDEKKCILKPPQTSQQPHAFGPCAAVCGGCAQAGQCLYIQ